MNRAGTILIAVLVLAGLIYALTREPVATVAPLEYQTTHMAMIDSYNDAHGTAYGYALVGLRRFDGPEIARAYRQNWTIMVSVGAAKLLSDEGVRDVIAHETAHLLTEDGHGPEWRAVYEELLDIAIEVE